MKCVRCLFDLLYLRTNSTDNTFKDWFHESCCNLRERPNSREPTPLIESKEPLQTAQASDNTNVDDAASEASSSGLPPPLITGDEYESFVCGSCVSRSPLLQRWLGTAGTIIVGRGATDEPWHRVEIPLKAAEELVEIEGLGQDETHPGIKRPLSPSSSAADGPEAKRAKSSPDVAASSSPCLAPPQDPLAQLILASLEGPDHDTSLGTGDVFFTLGFRERWCRCASVCRFTDTDSGLGFTLPIIVVLAFLAS